MVVKMFAVYDAVAGTYGPPFPCPNVELACRGIVDSASNPSNGLAKHANDLTLFELGTFDDSDGIMKALTAPLRIVVVANLLAAAK